MHNPNSLLEQRPNQPVTGHIGPAGMMVISYDRDFHQGLSQTVSQGELWLRESPLLGNSQMILAIFPVSRRGGIFLSRSFAFSLT